MALAAAVLSLGTAAVAAGHQLGHSGTPGILTAAAVPTVVLPAPTTTTEPPTTTTAAPATTAAPRPPTTRRSGPPAARRSPILAGSIDAFRGLGVWVDAYDWTEQFTNNKPNVVPADVDRMADHGGQTLYIQAAKHDAPGDVMEPALLQQFIDRAHARGMGVVAWYLPTLVDPARDLAHLLAINRLQVEGVGVDIESRDVSDAKERSVRLADLSTNLRQALPGRPIAAIVMPPVATDVINPAFWPGFPWHQLAPLYDVWMPMDYWTFRKSDSGYRDAYKYTAENIDRLRGDLGEASAAVHPIGGIGDSTTADDVDGYVRAAVERKSIGGGLYDFRTTADPCWPALQRFRI